MAFLFIKLNIYCFNFREITEAVNLFVDRHVVMPYRFDKRPFPADCLQSNERVIKLITWTTFTNARKRSSKGRINKKGGENDVHKDNQRQKKQPPA